MFLHWAYLFRMTVTPEIEEAIHQMVDRWVPDSQDRFLHINPNTYMKETVIKLIENNTIPPKLFTVQAVIKNWRFFLYKRFGALN